MSDTSKAQDFSAIYAELTAAIDTRAPSLPEDDIDMIEAEVNGALHRLMTTLARSLREVTLKGGIIVAEYGACDTIPASMVESMIADMRQLHE
jgi:hypothetical protein